MGASTVALGCFALFSLAWAYGVVRLCSSLQFNRVLIAVGVLIALFGAIAVVAGLQADHGGLPACGGVIASWGFWRERADRRATENERIRVLINNVQNDALRDELIALHALARIDRWARQALLSRLRAGQGVGVEMSVSVELRES
jgi:endonuclease/exonuclease/phosphatase (EEP) superfamily protein YafD